MLVAQAHSFRQQTRLAITLAWVSGYTNIVGLITCGTAVSHVSGIAAGFGRDVGDGRLSLLALAGWLLTWFLAGALVSGISTDAARVRGWKSIYVFPMAIETIALIGFGLLVARHARFHDGDGIVMVASPMFASTAVACFAMGLQNATITRISGGVVRTTHVTGVITDLGLELAHILSRHEPHRKRSTETPAGMSHRHRIVLLVSIVGSFAFGAGLAAMIVPRLHGWAMIPPVSFLLWVIYQDLSRPIADLEPETLVAEGAAVELPRNVAYFRLRCSGSHRGGLHRLPNMQLWVDSLDPEIDVAILDLSDADDVDFDGAVELRAVAERLHHSRRALVIAGVDARRFESLRSTGLIEVMPLGSVVGDVELALACALERADHFARRAKSEDFAPPLSG
ncbi:MAG: DUF1275 family protein [Planctomycetota bacterium]|nr:DUF1275 family protein [Planctomycetota bacterium]